MAFGRIGRKEKAETMVLQSHRVFKCEWVNGFFCKLVSSHMICMAGIIEGYRSLGKLA